MQFDISPLENGGHDLEWRLRDEQKSPSLLLETHPEYTNYVLYDGSEYRCGRIGTYTQLVELLKQLGASNAT